MPGSTDPISKVSVEIFLKEALKWYYSVVFETFR